MDINRVRYFHVFAETGSIVKASEILHISQPALSKALRLLEYETGLALIEPNGRGLRLTKSGEQFKTATSSLLQQWMKVPEQIGSLLQREPTKIGSFEVFTTYFLKRLVTAVEIHSLELHEYTPGKLERAISEGMVDIGITYVPIPIEGVEFTEATKIKMGVFGLKKFNRVPTEQLPFVAPLMSIDGTPSKVVGLDGWPDHKFKRNIRYRVTLMESALELCRMGMAVAYLPRFAVEIHNENVISELRLEEVQCPVPIRERMQSVFLGRNRRNAECALYRKLARCLRSLN
jgi:DNA-binding transcriptional LysR family regulator